MTKTCLARLLVMVSIAISTSVASAQPKGEHVTVTGEVVEMWCYLEAGDRGPAKKACATSCAKAGKPTVKIKLAPENLETEDILEMASAGLVAVTIADSHVALFWKQIFPNLTLHPEAAVRTGGAVGWMFRKDSPQLKAELNAALARYPERSWLRNELLTKYLKSTKWAKAATSSEEHPKFERTVELFKKFGARYDIDYLALMAQGYQESQLNQDARSPVGAIGIMQVMPATGRDMRVGDITQVEPNVHAGTKFLRAMMNEHYANEPMDRFNKALFTWKS